MTPEEIKQLNIFQRINEIRKKVKYAQKDKSVGEGGYKVVTHDLITALSREAFVEFGVVCIPNLIKSAVLTTGTFTQKQVPFIRYEATYRFGFVNIDVPSEVFSIEIESHAIDQGDKAPGKALSYAKKYAILKLLEIETGEEEESRDEQFRQKIAAGKPPASAEQTMKDAVDELPEDRKSVVVDTANAVIDMLLQEDPDAACDELERFTANSRDAGEKAALWGMLSKEHRKIIRETEKQRKIKSLKSLAKPSALTSA